MARFAMRLVGVLLPLACGCGGGLQGPETVKVTGVVTLDGDPLVGADVFFHPAGADGPLHACQAVTGPDGRFSVSTHIEAGQYKPGMVPGEYRVAISKLDTSQVTSTFTPPENVLPAQYASPETSGFAVNVLSDQENDFEFPLLDKG